MHSMFILGILQQFNMMYLNMKKVHECKLLILLQFFPHWAVNLKKVYFPPYDKSTNQEFIQTCAVFILGITIPFIKIYLYITHKVVNFLI